VLRGESPQPKDLEVAPRLQDPKGFSITIANHPFGGKPVLSVSDHDDFVLIMRCLAHRYERIPVQGTVHAQTVAGLIHWHENCSWPLSGRIIQARPWTES
jgi:hypothetical protein